MRAAEPSGEYRARAPGRVNLIGEHTDYNGGLVLPAPVDRDTRVRLRLRNDGLVRGRSRERGLAEAALDAAPQRDWLDYPRGMARVLAEAGWIAPAGFELEVESDLPMGAGLSSSAALLAASALALLGAAGRALDDAERPALAALCQSAEVEFVGVPCGLMDPFAVLCSTPGRALLLDCSSRATRPVTLPQSLALCIFDTGVERSLRSGAYAERSAECHRALDVARRRLGRTFAWLSELGPAELLELGPALDPAALRRARHVVSENQRVRDFASALASADFDAAGAALFASHASLRDDFEVSCPEADALVADAAQLPGCVGARLTGAGFGGCTLQLVHAARADAFSAALAERFRARFGRTPRHWRAALGARAERV
ncbi:MAG TPA: galactokinase [Myxococcota bacterium]|nr:galactokinase [Myxococcota bacterium]